MLVVHPETHVVGERRVDVGVRVPGIAEIREGMNEGELVIVRGINRVKDGQKVTFTERQDKAPAPDVPADAAPPAGATP